MALSVLEIKNIKTPWLNKTSITVAFISLVLGILLFLLAYFSINQGSGINSLNQYVLDWMVRSRQIEITNIMLIITNLASPIVIAVSAFALAIICAISKREALRPLLLAGAMFTATATSMIFKFLIANDRPAQSNMIAPFENDYSFPSGHTIAIFVLLLVIGYLVCSRRSSAKRIFVWISSTIVVTGLIIISRLYLGYHWTTDTIASVGLGLIILSIVIFVDKLFFKISNKLY